LLLSVTQHHKSTDEQRKATSRRSTKTGESPVCRPSLVSIASSAAGEKRRIGFVIDD